MLTWWISWITCLSHLICLRILLFSRETSLTNNYLLFSLAERFIWKRAITSGTPPSARDSHTCSSFRNKIIVIGGEDASDYYLSDVHILDVGMFLIFKRCAEMDVESFVLTSKEILNLSWKKKKKTSKCILYIVFMHTHKYMPYFFNMQEWNKRKNVPKCPY